MTTWKAGANIKNPNCDMTLSDGRKTVGMMLADKNGRRNAMAIRRGPYPRQSTKIATTDNKYSNMEPPYYATMQDDWVGGRGVLNLEDDTTRFADSYRAWTEQSKMITNGPQETYCTNYGAFTGPPTWLARNIHQSMPGKVNFTALMSDTAYLAHSLVNSQTMNVTKAAVIVKRVGTPVGDLLVQIWSNSGSSPGSLLKSVEITTADIEDTVSQLREVEYDTPVQTLTATAYWVVVRQSTGTPTAANHWEVGTNPDGYTQTKKSSTGTSWSNASYELYYRLIDEVTAEYRFFEYKRALYAYDKYSGYLFINGDRGAAEDAWAGGNYLQDFQKSWTNNEWAGCKVLLIKGPGASEKVPWRTIASNDHDSLVVTPDWDVMYDRTTEYVILGSNSWRPLCEVGTTVTDIAVSDEFVYFAMGPEVPVYRYCDYNEDGTWTFELYSEPIAKANRLKAINSPEGWKLWGGLDNHPVHGPCVWSAQIPGRRSSTSDLYNLISVLDDGKGLWDEQTITGVTVTQEDDGMKISLSGFEGYKDVCSKAIPAIDITKGTKISMLIKSLTSKDAGDLKLKLDDTPCLGQLSIADNVWHYDKELFPSKLYHFKVVGRPTAIYKADYVTSSYKWYMISNGKDQNGTSTFKLTLTNAAHETADYLYILYDQPFHTVSISITEGSGNSQVTDLHAQYFDGEKWADATIADYTSSGGKTLAVSGALNITMPSAWNPGGANDHDSWFPADKWVLKLHAGSATTSEISIIDIACWGTGMTEYPEEERWQDMAAPRLQNIEYEQNYFSPFYANDRVYIGSTSPFYRIKMNFLVTNNSAAYLTAKYWTGAGFSNMTIENDGTKKDGTKTFGQSGEIRLTQQWDWMPGAPAHIASVMGSDIYILELTINAVPTFASWIAITQMGLEDYLGNSFVIRSLPLVKDGSTLTYENVSISADDYIYVMGSSKYNGVYWNLESTSHVDTWMEGQYFNGDEWFSLTITEDETKGGGSYSWHYGGYVWFNIPDDWKQLEVEGETGYVVRFYPFHLDLPNSLKIREISLANQNAVSVDLPALAADTWTYVEMDISPNASPDPDESKIVSIGLYSVHGATQVYTIGKVELITEAMSYLRMGNDRINSIEAYGDERMNPWVFTESMIYEIQTQNNNAVVPIPLQEISTMRSELNGMAHTVNGVYLVFNLGAYVEKYYQHNLDDIGPNRDEGLPGSRQGYPISMLSYPGRIFLALNAGSDGYSTIMIRGGSGWHEIYRSPYGASINGMILQVVPGMNTRLWVSQGHDLLWIPVPTGTWSPQNDSNFKFTHESVLTTGWVSVGFLDISKIWKSVKLFTENLSGTNQYVLCEYQMEDGSLESGWTPITSTFDSSPFEEQLISPNYDISARRIRFRYRLITTSNLEAPIIKASVIESLLRFPVRYSYNCTIMLSDYKESYVDKDNSFRVELDTDQLEEWGDQAIVLTMRCNYSPYDNKKVVLEPLTSNPIPPFSTEEQIEKHLATMTLLEV